MPDYIYAIHTSVKNTWQDAENLDEEHGYVSYIWIPEETFKIDVLKLAVFTEKFRAYSKAALSRDLGVKTTGPSGGHWHSVSGATTTVVTPSHTHKINIGVKTSSSAGEHKHKMFGFLSDTPGGFSLKQFNCTNQIGLLTSVDLYAQSSEALYTREAAGAHTHNVEIGTVTSEAGGGAHSHKVSGQTTSTVDDHTHDVPIGSHDHEIDFGIYEEDITGRTLSAKLYDPDGNLVKDFGVICMGEGAVTLDLTDYFEVLKYGFWRLELSASGRMRVRLLYYELCKMYAQY